MVQYQVAYNTNGQPKLFEFYLFINPIGTLCQAMEKEVAKTIRQIDAKTEINIICFTPQQVVTQHMKRLNIPTHDLNQRNQVFKELYLASLAHKAATLQGKRKGRNFLLALQRWSKHSNEHLTERVLESLALSVDLDIELFHSDRQSQYVQDLYLRDQQIAHEMNVKQTPTLVIFEQSSNLPGFSIEGNLNCYEILHHLDKIVASSLPKNIYTIKPLQ